MISFAHRSPVPTAGRFLSGAIAGLLLAGSICRGQEIEPRRWSHLPLGSDFIGAAYAYTTGDITFDPLLRIEEGEFELHTVAVKYIHSFDLIGKSARIDLTQGYQSGEWSGLLNGVPAAVDREGWSDTLLRFAVNLYGAPPLAGKEYAEYRTRTKAETIVGAGIGVQLPTGNYLSDKLINLGSNRFTFRPQLGFVRNQGSWSIEVNAAALLYTDNNHFFQGKHLEQDPFYTADGHLIYTFRPGLWLGAGAGYGYGGETTVNEVSSHNTQRNFAWGLSLGIPLHRQLGLKLAWINTRTLTSTGADTDTFTGGFSFMW